MSKSFLVLFVLILGTLLGGALFLMTWEIPAPGEPVEKVLPDDRFPS